MRLAACRLLGQAFASLNSPTALAASCLANIQPVRTLARAFCKQLDTPDVAGALGEQVLCFSFESQVLFVQILRNLVFLTKLMLSEAPSTTANAVPDEVCVMPKQFIKCCLVNV